MASPGRVRVNGLVFNGKGVGPRNTPALVEDRAQSVCLLPSGGEPPGVLDIGELWNVEGNEAEGINGRLRGGGEGPRRACGGWAVVALGKKGAGRCRCCSRGGAAVIFVEHQAAAFDIGEGWRRRHGLVVMGWVGHSDGDGDNGEQRGRRLTSRLACAVRLCGEE